MPEFKTIEELVTFLDEHAKTNMIFAKAKNSDALSRGCFAGIAIAYDYIADVLRNSNLGVVVPPADASGGFRERVAQIATSGPAEPADG